MRRDIDEKEIDLMRNLARVLVLALFVPLLGVSVAPANAADGDTLRSFLADLPTCGTSVGIAFDGHDLLTSCYTTNVVTVVSTLDGHRIRQFPVAGVTGLGALAWDKGRQGMWACVFTSTTWQEQIGFISFDQNGNASATVAFIPAEGCFDGLAYDGTDDTLFSSMDVGDTVYHYTTGGQLIESRSIVGLLGDCGNSGIAVGGPYLFLGNNGCSQLYRATKQPFGTPQLYASVAGRIEDLECDDHTFSALGKAAIWTKDAHDNQINAFELNPGDCAYGGGGPVGIYPPLVQAPAGALVDLTIDIDQTKTGPTDRLVTKIVSGPNATGVEQLDCAPPNGCLTAMDLAISVRGKGGAGDSETLGVGTDTIVAFLDKDGDRVQDADEYYGTGQIEWVRRTNYVAMGDSFSAGEGVDPYDSGTDNDTYVFGSANQCHRSVAAYSRLTHAPHAQRTVQEYATDGTTGTTLDFIACSGARTYHLEGLGQWGEPGQLSNPALTAGTDLVTLSIGGNDVGFSDILTACVFTPDCQTQASLSELGGQSLDAYVNSKLDFLSAKLPAIYTYLRNTAAPDATIVVLGYPHLFPDTVAEQDCIGLQGASPIGFENGEQDYLNNAADVLSARIAAAAAQAGVYYVDVRGTFANHEICGNGGAWVSGITLPDLNDPVFHGKLVGTGAFHPNLLGQQGYAAALDSFLASVTTGANVKTTGLPANPAPGAAAMAAAQAAATAPQTWLGSLYTTQVAGDWQTACLRKELVTSGHDVRLRGIGFAPGASVAITGQPIGGTATTLATVSADANGYFTKTVTVPTGLSVDASFRLEARGTAAEGGTQILSRYVGVARPCPDTVKPSVTITRPMGTYGVGQPVTAAYACTDAESGIASCVGTVANGAAVNTGTAGSKSFSVTATDVAGNTQTASSPYTVAYGAPVVTSVAPATGPATGGTAITISGYNFAPGSTVKVGSASATAVTVVSPTSITATTPAGSGTQGVTVTSTYGTSNADKTFAYQSTATFAFNYKGTINSKGKVVDSSTANNPGTIKIGFGGTIKQTTDSTYGDYLRWPLTACLTAPTNSSCPEAVINPSVVTNVNPSPAAGNFEFGATVRIASAITGQAGMNIMQRGNFAAGQHQWKLQVEWKSSRGYRVASCRFSDGTNAVLVEGTKAIVPGTWYDLSCNRTGNTFTLSVIEKGGATGDEVVSATASIGGIAPTLAPSIGAKEILTAKGKTDLDVDQFHGDMDDIYFKRY